MERDVADELESQWAKIGVTIQINALSADAYRVAHSRVSYEDCEIARYSTDDSWAFLFTARTGSEGCSAKDPTYNAAYDAAQATQDLVKRTAIMKDLGVYFLDNVYGLGFANPYVLNCYWPWIKNYDGEITAGNCCDIMPMVNQLWIDQAMKKSMGH